MTKIPEVNLVFRIYDEFHTKSTYSDNLFKGKRVVVFSLPGAFTPTCSTKQLPSYDERYKEFTDLGIDDVFCISVNDGFVINAWASNLGLRNILMLPDGNGEFSEKLGFLVDKSDLGFGKRSWRYSMLVEDGVITKMFIEEERAGDPFDSSDADTMLKYLGGETPKSVTVYTRPGCEFCAEAKALLKQNNLPYEEHVLNQDYSIKTLVAISGGTKVPQVFINGERIGGADRLKDYLGK